MLHKQSKEIFDRLLHTLKSLLNPLTPPKCALKHPHSPSHIPLAMPKSPSFKTSLEVMKILSVLISRCKMRIECIYSIADKS